MARRVILNATGPVKLGPLDKPASICACGLSRTFPLCDGSHKTTSKLEEPGFLYEYDPATLQVVDKQPGYVAPAVPNDQTTPSPAPSTPPAP